jgi:hypothetical protein
MGTNPRPIARNDFLHKLKRKDAAVPSAHSGQIWGLRLQGSGSRAATHCVLAVADCAVGLEDRRAIYEWTSALFLRQILPIVLPLEAS